MYLIEILLPLTGNDGAPFPQPLFGEVRRELVERFGGLTAFSRAPAEGVWDGGEEGAPARDDIVVFEVMAETLDRGWWADWRRRLEERFAQDEIVVRSREIERL